MKKLIAVVSFVLLLLPLSGCEKAYNFLSTTSDEYKYLMELAESDIHTHEDVEKPQTVSDPITGYCGNIITKIVSTDGERSFWGDDSVELTDIVINLKYSQPMCKCLAEFEVYVETEEKPYEVNLTEAYVRLGEKQADLTAEQVKTIRDIYNRKFSSNADKDLCGYPKSE